MKTIVYISRHGESISYENVNNNLDILTQNMMTPLSIDGEEGASKLLSIIGDVDVVYSSNYARAIDTAKYVALGKKVNVDYRLGERIHGIKESYSELPKGFGSKQIEDENFKLLDGESRGEVAFRMNEIINEIVSDNRGKKIYITSHSAAITFWLMSVCELKSDNGLSLLYKDNLVIDDSFKWESKIPKTFELIFDDDLVSVRCIN